eukprot:COSAG02_NODE_73_length_41919_cov_6.571066_35_plen_277_part_00
MDAAWAGRDARNWRARRLPERGAHLDSKRHDLLGSSSKHQPHTLELYTSQVSRWRRILGSCKPCLSTRGGVFRCHCCPRSFGTIGRDAGHGVPENVRTSGPDHRGWWLRRWARKASSMICTTCDRMPRAVRLLSITNEPSLDNCASPTMLSTVARKAHTHVVRWLTLLLLPSLATPKPSATLLIETTHHRLASPENPSCTIDICPISWPSQGPPSLHLPYDTEPSLHLPYTAPDTLHDVLARPLVLIGRAMGPHYIPAGTGLAAGLARKGPELQRK